MKKEVYDDFIKDELDDFVREQLISAISKQDPKISTFGYNRFNVELDFINRKATIEDTVIYDNENDDYVLSMDSFVEMLGINKGKMD